MVRNQGYFIFTEGFIKTSIPILAPKRRNKKILNPLKTARLWLKNIELINSHETLFMMPPGRYQELS